MTEVRAGCYRGVYIAAMLMLPALPGLAADDAYLNALENEAAGLSVDPATTVEGHTTASAQLDAHGRGPANRLPSDLDRAAFEEALQLNYVGSYVFYQRLPEASKKAVFDVYRKSGDMVAVRDKLQSELKAK